MTSIVMEKTPGQIDRDAQLKKDVLTVLRIARRKGGVNAGKICDALGLPHNFLGYRYRKVLRTAKQYGLRIANFGKWTTYHY
jgi:hypothetical protein